MALNELLHPYSGVQGCGDVGVSQDVEFITFFKMPITKPYEKASEAFIIIWASYLMITYSLFVQCPVSHCCCYCTKNSASLDE